ncbi:hypothetical protein [Nitratireductor sp. XY-223]|uniref:hypothetical protein n=1 Tax=Nitratireductor sp. XY-223 TaxID=2561926 RepID=UPI0010AA4358|nr:hypothetical protein [Nitratireductor sp. XY-223]
MSDTPVERPREPLGIGNIVSETFGILGGNIPAVLILGGVPSLASLILTRWLLGAAFVTATGNLNGDPTIVQTVYGFTAILVNLIWVAVYGVAVGLFVQFAYDSKFDRPIQLARYVQRALASAVHVVVLTIIITLLAFIGFAFFIVPGLWVYAVFSVTIPAVVIERAGFDALGRSISLTKEYRWPIVLLTVIVAVITAVISMIGTFLVFFVPGGLVFDMIVLAVFYGIIYGVFGTLTFLIYARLREIKDGYGAKDLVSVFE